MTEKCSSNDCSSCNIDCDSRKTENTNFTVALNDQSNVKKVVGIVSGKGGVGKSLITSVLAVKMNNKGYKTAILDGDITGPSIPKAFGIDERLNANSQGYIIPAVTNTGIDLVSTNLLLDHVTDPVVWRGSIVSNVIKQFWSETVWEDEDILFVDMPPGTGDVPLTVYQAIPLDGIIIVTSPQELVSMIVAKAVKMAGMMDVPILGIVENMSYFMCPDCSKQHKIFGESHIESISEEYGIPVLAKIPMDPQVSSLIDSGAAEFLEAPWLDSAADTIEQMLKM